MEIDLIPKRTVVKDPLQAPLSFISLGLLLISVVATVLLLNNIKRISGEIAVLDSELFKERSGEEISLEKEILIAQKKITAFNLLVKEREEVSKALNLIEKRIHPQAVLDKIDYNSKEDKIWLNGVADNFQILGQQLLLFKQDPLVQEANFSYIGIEKTGGVGFNMEVVFRPGFFKD